MYENYDDTTFFSILVITKQKFWKSHYAKHTHVEDRKLTLWDCRRFQKSTDLLSIRFVLSHFCMWYFINYAVQLSLAKLTKLREGKTKNCSPSTILAVKKS